MRDDLRRVAMFGSGVAELTRNRAEQLAKDLIARSNKNRSELMRLIRSEISSQLAALGVATKRDLERLERRLARLETSAKAQARSTTVKKTTPKKTSSKKKTSATSGTTKSPGG